MKGKTTYKRPIEHSAARTLGRFFSKLPDKDKVTKAEIFVAWDRDKPEYESKNEGWLSNKLVGIYYYGLANPIYSHNPYRHFAGLELTTKGKRALGRIDAPNTAEDTEIVPTLTRAATQSEWTIDDLIVGASRVNEKLTTHKVRVTLEEVANQK